MLCLAPRVLKDSVRPRRRAGVVVRPLNVTVRRRLVSLRRTINATVGLALLGGLTYCSYGYLTAGSRVRATCASIPLGASPHQLLQFGALHGLNVPPGDYKNAVHTLGETRTLGRYGCRVHMVNGVVAQVDYY